VQITTDNSPRESPPPLGLAPSPHRTSPPSPPVAPTVAPARARNRNRGSIRAAGRFPDPAVTDPLPVVIGETTSPADLPRR